MSIVFLLYCVDVLGKIACILSLFIIITIILLVILIINFLSNIDNKNIDKSKEDKILIKYVSIIFIILLILGLILPTKNTMYIMIGAKYLGDSSLPLKEKQAIELKLDDVIKSLSVNKDK